MILEFILNMKNEIELNEDEIKTFLYLILPNIKERIKIKNQLRESIKKLKPNTLEPELYLDFDKDGNVIADLKFKYDQSIFNPLKTENIKINRNILQEAKIYKR